MNRWPVNGGRAQPFPVRSTPVPNLLLDALMPALSDSQWRLVCAVVRATLGWIDPQSGGRKSRAWITQRQLMARAGRKSEAVSRAIDALMKAGLIEVTDQTGRPLNTSAERRRAPRLFFALRLPAEERPGVPASSVLTGRVRKADTTKESQILKKMAGPG
jgi:hypothetical protein